MNSCKTEEAPAVFLSHRDTRKRKGRLRQPITETVLRALYERNMAIFRAMLADAPYKYDSCEITSDAPFLQASAEAWFNIPEGHNIRFTKWVKDTNGVLLPFRVDSPIVGDPAIARVYWLIGAHYV